MYHITNILNVWHQGSSSQQQASSRSSPCIWSLSESSSTPLVHSYSLKCDTSCSFPSLSDHLRLSAAGDADVLGFLGHLEDAGKDSSESRKPFNGISSKFYGASSPRAAAVSPLALCRKERLSCRPIYKLLLATPQLEDRVAKGEDCFPFQGTSNVPVPCLDLQQQPAAPSPMHASSSRSPNSSISLPVAGISTGIPQALSKASEPAVASTRAVSEQQKKPLPLEVTKNQPGSSCVPTGVQCQNRGGVVQESNNLLVAGSEPQLNQAHMQQQPIVQPAEPSEAVPFPAANLNEGSTAKSPSNTAPSTSTAPPPANMDRMRPATLMAELATKPNVGPPPRILPGAAAAVPAKSMMSHQSSKQQQLGRAPPPAACSKGLLPLLVSVPQQQQQQQQQAQHAQHTSPDRPVRSDPIARPEVAEPHPEDIDASAMQPQAAPAPEQAVPGRLQQQKDIYQQQQNQQKQNEQQQLLQQRHHQGESEPQKQQELVPVEQALVLLQYQQRPVRSSFKYHISQDTQEGLQNQPPPGHHQLQQQAYQQQRLQFCATPGVALPQQQYQKPEQLLLLAQQNVNSQAPNVNRHQSPLQQQQQQQQQPYPLYQQPYLLPLPQSHAMQQQQQQWHPAPQQVTANAWLGMDSTAARLTSRPMQPAAFAAPPSVSMLPQVDNYQAYAAAGSMQSMQALHSTGQAAIQPQQHLQQPQQVLGSNSGQEMAPWKLQFQQQQPHQQVQQHYQGQGCLPPGAPLPPTSAMLPFQPFHTRPQAQVPYMAASAHDVPGGFASHGINRAARQGHAVTASSHALQGQAPSHLPYPAAPSFQQVSMAQKGITLNQPGTCQPPQANNGLAAANTKLQTSSVPNNSNHAQQQQQQSRMSNAAAQQPDQDSNSAGPIAEGGGFMRANNTPIHVSAAAAAKYGRLLWDEKQEEARGVGDRGTSTSLLQGQASMPMTRLLKQVGKPPGSALAESTDTTAATAKAGSTVVDKQTTMLPQMLKPKLASTASTGGSTVLPPSTPSAAAQAPGLPSTASAATGPAAAPAVIKPPQPVQSRAALCGSKAAAADLPDQAHIDLSGIGATAARPLRTPGGLPLKQAGTYKPQRPKLINGDLPPAAKRLLKSREALGATIGRSAGVASAMSSAIAASGSPPPPDCPPEDVPTQGPVAAATYQPPNDRAQAPAAPAVTPAQAAATAAPAAIPAPAPALAAAPMLPLTPAPAAVFPKGVSAPAAAPPTAQPLLVNANSSKASNAQAAQYPSSNTTHSFSHAIAAAAAAVHSSAPTASARLTAAQSPASAPLAKALATHVALPSWPPQVCSSPERHPQKSQGLTESELADLAGAELFELQQLQLRLQEEGPTPQNYGGHAREQQRRSGASQQARGEPQWLGGHQGQQCPHQAAQQGPHQATQGQGMLHQQELRVGEEEERYSALQQQPQQGAEQEQHCPEQQQPDQPRHMQQQAYHEPDHVQQQPDYQQFYRERSSQQEHEREQPSQGPGHAQQPHQQQSDQAINEEPDKHLRYEQPLNKLPDHEQHQPGQQHVQQQQSSPQPDHAQPNPDGQLQRQPHQHHEQPDQRHSQHHDLDSAEAQQHNPASRPNSPQPPLRCMPETTVEFVPETEMHACLRDTTTAWHAGALPAVAAPMRPRSQQQQHSAEAATSAITPPPAPQAGLEQEGAVQAEPVAQAGPAAVLDAPAFPMSAGSQGSVAGNSVPAAPCVFEAAVAEAEGDPSAAIQTEAAATVKAPGLAPFPDQDEEHGEGVPGSNLQRTITTNAGEGEGTAATGQGQPPPSSQRLLLAPPLAPLCSQLAPGSPLLPSQPTNAAEPQPQSPQPTTAQQPTYFQQLCPERPAAQPEGSKLPAHSPYTDQAPPSPESQRAAAISHQPPSSPEPQEPATSPQQHLPSSSPSSLKPPFEPAANSHLSAAQPSSLPLRPLGPPANSDLPVQTSSLPPHAHGLVAPSERQKALPEQPGQAASAAQPTTLPGQQLPASQPPPVGADVAAQPLVLVKQQQAQVQPGQNAVGLAKPPNLSEQGPRLQSSLQYAPRLAEGELAAGGGSNGVMGVAATDGLVVAGTAEVVAAADGMKEAAALGASAAANGSKSNAPFQQLPPSKRRKFQLPTCDTAPNDLSPDQHKHEQQGQRTQQQQGGTHSVSTGFQTANSKPVRVRPEAMLQAAKLFDGLPMKQQQCVQAPQHEKEQQQHSQSHQDQACEQVQQQQPHQFHHPLQAGQHEGGQQDRPMQDRVHEQLQQQQQQQQEVQGSTAPKYPGFLTGKGKQVHANPEAMRMAAKLFGSTATNQEERQKQLQQGYVQGCSSSCLFAKPASGHDPEGGEATPLGTQPPSGLSPCVAHTPLAISPSSGLPVASYAMPPPKARSPVPYMPASQSHVSLQPIPPGLVTNSVATVSAPDNVPKSSGRKPVLGLSRSVPSSASAPGSKKRTCFKSPTPLNYTRPKPHQPGQSAEKGKGIKQPRLLGSTSPSSSAHAAQQAVDGVPHARPVSLRQYFLSSSLRKQPLCGKAAAAAAAAAESTGGATGLQPSSTAAVTAADQQPMDSPAALSCSLKSADINPSNAMHWWCIVPSTCTPADSEATAMAPAPSATLDGTEAAPTDLTASSHSPHNAEQAEQSGMAAESVGQRFDVGFVHQELLAMGADKKLATLEWVANHFRWIVWKLASYERVFSSACAGQALTCAAVMQQLQHRYNREHVLGHIPAVRALLQQDITPRAALSLLVAAIPLSPSATKLSEAQGCKNLAVPLGHGQQLQQGSDLAVGGAGPVSLELSDGWYSIAATLDEPLAQLVINGKLKVGAKLRISSAQIHAPRGPCNPLSPCDLKSTALRLAYNAVSPLPWDAKLGYQKRPVSFRPLGLIHPCGGPIPCTVVVVQAKYATQYWEKVNNQSMFRTERHQKKRERIVLDFTEQAESYAEQGVRASEQAYCRQLLNSSPGSQPQQGPIRISPVQRVYASLVLKDGMLLTGEGGAIDVRSVLNMAGVQEHIASLANWSHTNSQDLCKLMKFRRTVLTEQLIKARTRILASLQGLHDRPDLSGSEGNAASHKLTEGCGVPTRRLLLSAAVHGNAPPGAENVEAWILLWRPKDDCEESSLTEGGVYLVTNLEPIDKPSNKWGLLELRAGKHTTWKQLGFARDMSTGITGIDDSLSPARIRVSWPSERLRLKAADLPQMYRMLTQEAQHQQGQQQQQPGRVAFGRCQFDYLGLVVGIGPVRYSGGLHGRLQIVSQWVYLADDSTHHMHDSQEAQQQQQQQQQDGQSPRKEPWLVAIKIEGSVESVDLLDMTSDMGQLFLFRHLQLTCQEARSRVWLASAPDTSSHVHVPCPPLGRDKGASEVACWMGSCSKEVEAARQHAQEQLRLR